LCTREDKRERYRRVSDLQGRPKAPAPPPVIDGCKACNDCGESKPLDAFPRRGDGYGDGYKHRCKACTAAAARNQRKAAASGRGGPPPDPEGFKTCRGCGELKQVSEFYAKGRGLHSRCKPCFNACNQERYRNNPELRDRHKVLRDRWRGENPTYYADYYEANRERLIAAATEYSKRNPVDPEHRRAVQRAWYAATVEERRAKNRAWREANLEAARGNARHAAARRRARMRGLPFESYTMADIVDRDGTSCVLCGEEMDMMATAPEPMAATIEHLECISWEASAGDVLANVGLSHFICNTRRNTREHPAAAAKRAELLAAEAAAS